MVGRIAPRRARTTHAPDAADAARPTGGATSRERTCALLTCLLLSLVLHAAIRWAPPLRTLYAAPLLLSPPLSPPLLGELTRSTSVSASPPPPPGAPAVAANAPATLPNATTQRTQRLRLGACSLLFTLRLPLSGGDAVAALLTVGAAGERHKLPGGGCGDDPAAWIAPLREDEWWAAHPHVWAESTCGAALNEEGGSAAAGKTAAPPLQPGPLARALRAARLEAERRGCVFLSLTTLQEPALAAALTYDARVNGSLWTRRRQQPMTLHDWAHTHPEMLLVEHLWRAHFPAGDGPGTEAALTPRGEWADAARLPGLPLPPAAAPPPPSPPPPAEGAAAGGGASMLAAVMQQDLAAVATAGAQAAPLPPTPLRPDWVCEPELNADMLRVCGHMEELHAQIAALQRQLASRRAGFGTQEQFDAACGAAACGELAPGAAGGEGAEQADSADVGCCELRHEETALVQDRYAASRGAYMRFKRGAYGCAPIARNASAPLLAEFDIVAPAARVEEAVLLAALSLHASETAATGAFASASSAAHTAAALAADAAARTRVSDADMRALRSFNTCSLAVYAEAEKQFNAMMAAAGEPFAALIAIARRRRTEAEAARGDAGATQQLAVLEAGKG